MALGLLQTRGLKPGERAEVQLVKIPGYLYARIGKSGPKK